MSGDFFATIASYLVHFSFLLLLVYLLIVVCCELASNIRFIPFNVRLNTLSKLQKRAKLSHKILAVQICKTTICIFLLIEDSASVIFLLEYAFLDILLHGTIICFIVLSVLTLRFGARSLSYLFIQYVKIFNPCFENNDLTALWIFTLLLVLSSDVHPNPGPHSADQRFSNGFLSFCNWNLNTLSKDDFYRISLLEAHNTVFNYDIISLCETSLNAEISVPENALPGYIYHPLNNPDGSRNGGVGIFYKDSLPLRIRSDLSFDECLVSELIFGHKKIFFTVFYRNPKHDVNSVGFLDFVTNFENLCTAIKREKPYAMFFAGDVNGHTQAWYPEGDTNPVGAKLEEMFSEQSLHQIITEPTHYFRDDCNPSCIDIILTDQPNLVMNSGVRPTLDPTVKHQMTFCKLNFKIPPPPKYKRKIWHFSRAQTQQIERSVSEFPWSEHLEHLQNPSQQVDLLNKTIINIMYNFIPSEEIVVRPSDPPWFNRNIRHCLKKHNKIYRKYIKNGASPEDKILWEKSKSDVSTAILTAKEAYLKQQGAKLADPSTSSKAYWKILNSFLNKCKIPRIPPLFVEGNFITNCKEKASTFNKYFAAQCTPFQTDSVLPGLVYHTSSRLSFFEITLDDVSDIIKVLDVNKAHGPDNISVKMIKLCGDGICVPLRIIFRTIMETGTFPDQWKEANVTPVHKKKDKQTVTNYRPISLLPIFAKMFERIVFKNLFNYLKENDLITKNQSGFTPGDSGTNQLLSLVHDIHLAFDDNSCLEVRSVYLDMSKAFDKVWHEGLLHKLKQNGIDGKLLKLLTNYLSNRKQRVVLNGEMSDWAPIYSGVPQGSVLGPLLFLIFINDLEAGIISQIKFFADDTSLYSVVKDPEVSAQELNHDLIVISNWAKQWKMSFNPDPTKPAEEIVFSHKKRPNLHPPLFFNGIEVKRVKEHKHLGLIFDPKLNFAAHFKEKMSKARKGIGLIKRLRSYLPTNVLDQIYKMHVRPHLDYCDFIYHVPKILRKAMQRPDHDNDPDVSDDENHPNDDNDIYEDDDDSNKRLNTRMQALESLQYQAALAVTGAWKGSSTRKIYKELGWESLHHRRWFRRMTQFFKIMNGLTPQYLLDPIPVPRRHLFGRFATNDLYEFTCRNLRYLHSFYPDSVISWNSLGPEIRKIESISEFKKKLLETIRPHKAHPIFNVHDPENIKYIYQLRVGLSQLKSHKKKHNFRDTPTDICSCGTGVESTSHFLLFCPFFRIQRQALFSTISSILNSNSKTPDMSNLDNAAKVDTLLYGNENLNFLENKSVLTATIKYISSTGRLNQM